MRYRQNTKGAILYGPPVILYGSILSRIDVLCHIRSNKFNRHKIDRDALLLTFYIMDQSLCVNRIHHIAMKIDLDIRISVGSIELNICSHSDVTQILSKSRCSIWCCFYFSNLLIVYWPAKFYCSTKSLIEVCQFQSFLLMINSEIFERQ